MSTFLRLEVAIVDDGGPVGANDLVGRLGNARLELPRRAPGYHAGDVDAFLGKIVETLKRGGQPDPDQVRRAQFRTTRLRPGYDKRRVDALLDGAEQRLRSRGSTSFGDQPESAPGSAAAHLMERIKNARFRVIRRAAGYDEQDVDTFLDKIVAALSRGEPLTPAQAGGAQFRITRMRPGYVQQDVDDLLEQIRRHFGGYDL